MSGERGVTTPPQASDWIRQLARSTPAPIQWDRVVITALGITAPVGLALMIAPHETALVGAASLMSMGALVASARDVGVARVERLRRMALATVLATLGFALGTLVYGNPLAVFITVVVATLLSGLAGTVSASASRAALYFLVYAVTAANVQFGLTDAWMAPLLFLAGALWRILLTVIAAAATGRVVSPERRKVAEVYAALASQLAATTPDEDRAAAKRLTDALDAAYDAIAAARTHVAEREGRWPYLVTVLNASAPVVDAVIAVSKRAAPVERAAVTFLQDLSRRILDPRLDTPQFAGTSVAGDAALSAEQTALYEALHTVGRVARAAAIDPHAAADGSNLPRVPTVAERLRSARHDIAAGGETWFSVLRLVLCMGIAQGLSSLLHLDRPYLVMLTVAQVMKPDFGSVFVRAVQRGGGTTVGVALGTLAMYFVPHGGWQVLVIFVLAAAIPIVMPRNYGLYAIVTVPLAVVLVEVHAGVDISAVGTRMLDTLLGCAIVLIVGYLPWPSTWRAPRNLASGVAELARTVAGYLSAALSVGDTDDASRARMRRATYRAISDEHTRLTRSLGEPPAISSVAIAWMPTIGALERVADAVTTVATATAAGGDPPSDDDVARCRAALDELADGIATHRDPTPGELPRTGALRDLGDEIEAAFAASRVEPVRSHARRRHA